MQQKVLGLDLGDRHIGVAIVDMDARVALPLTTLSNNRQFTDELLRLKKEHGFLTIVVGLPLTLSGSDSPQTHKVRELAAKIAEKTDCEVILEDERFTTHQASQLLTNAAHDPASSVDAISAQLILQAWMDKQEKA